MPTRARVRSPPRWRGGAAGGRRAGSIRGGGRGGVAHRATHGVRHVSANRARRDRVRIRGRERAVRYVVDVDGTRFEVTLDGGAASVDGGAPCAANLSEGPGTPVRIVRIGDAVHRVTVRREGARGRYVLRLGGRRFAVEALDERTRAIRDLSLAHAPPPRPPAPPP